MIGMVVPRRDLVAQSVLGDLLPDIRRKAENPCRLDAMALVRGEAEHAAVGVTDRLAQRRGAAARRGVAGGWSALIFRTVESMAATVCCWVAGLVDFPRKPRLGAEHAIAVIRQHGGERAAVASTRLGRQRDEVQRGRRDL